MSLLALLIALPAQITPPAAAVVDAPADTATAAQGAPDKLVALLDLKTEGDTSALSNALSSVLAGNITARDGLRCVARGELKALLQHLADANTLGCESASCAMDVAKLVDAQLVITGTLGKIPGADGSSALALSLTLLDPLAQSVVARSEVTWRGAAEELVTVVPSLLDKLFDGPAAATYTGALEVATLEGAVLALDGKELGKAPLKEAVRDVPIGVHALSISAGGYVTKDVDVVVSRNETTIARVVLEEEPYYTQWWFWTAVGGGAAVAVAAGTTIGVVALLNEEPPATPPTRIVVKAPLPSTSAGE